MKSINPSTGELIQEYKQMGDEELAGIVEKANKAQKTWRKTTFRERSGFLENVATKLENQKEELAELMATEMGKPLAQGVSEAEKCAWVCRYYADHAAKFLDDEYIQTDATKSYVTFNPMGTVLAVMPWNFPLWQFFRFAAPAFMAGNAGLLSHSANVSGCALKIEDIISKAGIPKDLFRTLLADNDQTTALIEHKGIAAVTLTGSTRAGKAVAAKAGSELKKTVLELGGSDPYLILKNADLKKTAETCVNSRLTNSGQSCIAAKRFIVVKEDYEAFKDMVVEKMEQKKMGDPFVEETDVGPMAREDLRDALHKQVQESIEQGAECLLGGKIPDGKGAFYPPTVLTNISKSMPAYHEELFGPVACIIKATDEREAIEIANDTSYGLGAAVFSNDIKRAEKIAAEELEAGCCFVNEFVKSDPRLPFGGIKQSGYGRELSNYGIKEFVNIKTVYCG